MASLSASIAQGCSASGGVFTLTQADPAPGATGQLTYAWVVLDEKNTDYGGQFDPALLPISVDGLANGAYRLRIIASEDDGSAYYSQVFERTLSCSATGSGLLLDSLAHTDEKASLHDGTATIQASGGVPPLTATVVELGRSQPATSGQPAEFSGLAPDDYTVQVTDSASPPSVVGGPVRVLPYLAPVLGCQDEYADTYNPLATTDTTPSACTYSPRWRSAWGPTGIAVGVPALPGQATGYTAARLRIGFRPGHPLAADRLLGEPLTLRATVGPDGYATFRLGPYLRAALGAPDGAGGYRLDRNSPTAESTDLFVGYELRRLTGELLEHGYALNSAVPDAQIPTLLTPFATLPLWPGFTHSVPARVSNDLRNFAFLTTVPGSVDNFDAVALPCPSHPLPVCWLAPQGGYGYWVFAGRHQLGDEVGDSQSYTEPGSGQRRYAQRGEARGTITASSGVFNGPLFADGLRTLWASPQAWVWGGEEWVPVTLEGGSFPVRRMGLARTEVSITMTEARAAYAQGQ